MLDVPNHPVKTRELHNHHFNSTVWNDFAFRDDDIVIATYAKSGTTWMQQIVSQLIFNGAEGLPVAEMSPWLDLRVPPKAVKLPLVEAQTHRRFLKTHLPVDALVFSPTGEVRLRRPRRAGRGVEPLQPSRQRQRPLVRGAERHAGAGRRPDRTAPGLGRRLLPRLAGARWPPVLAVLGEPALLVGDPRPAQRAARAFPGAEGRHAGGDPPHRRLPGDPRSTRRSGGRSSSTAASPT